MTIGFSVRRDVINKGNEQQLNTLHRDWEWITNGTPNRLLKAVSKGIAITPAKWTDGYKSKYKGVFEESHYIMLDFDNGMTLSDAINNEFIASTASFIYTSPSHLKPGKGERFRVVWKLSTPITNWKDHDDVILALRQRLEHTDDPAINAASCLFGSQPLDDNWCAHIFNGHRNELDPTPLIDEQQQKRAQKRQERLEMGYVDGDLWEHDKDSCGEDRVALMIHCLKVQESTGFRYVPDRQPGCNTWSICRDVLFGLVHYFGVELTYQILEDADWYGDNTNGDWDVDRLIDEATIREEMWEPGDSWCSYGTILKYAKQELGNPDLTHDPGFYSPAMPGVDFNNFKFNDSLSVVDPISLLTSSPTTQVVVDNSLVTEHETNTYSTQIDEIVRLELSDNRHDNKKATLLKAKVAKLFSISPATLNKDVHKAAMHFMGVDLHGESSPINTNPDDSGWDFGEDSEDVVEYQVAGVLPKNGTTAIAGVGGSGKNLLVGYYGYRIVEGLPCIPHPEMPVQKLGKKILFIATDQAGGAKKRIANDFRNAGADNQWLMDNVKIIAADPKRGEPAWTATTKGFYKLKQLMDSGEFGLVIVDSLKTIVAGTEYVMTDNNDMSLLTRSLMLIVNPYASMIIINHAAEPSAKKIPTINEMQTATAFGQMIDAVFIIRKPQDGGYFRELYGVKIRDNNDGVRISYTPNNETGELELLPGCLSPEASRSDEILKVISERNPTPATASYIAKSINMETNQVSNYLTKANSTKLIKRHGRGYKITAKGKRHLEQLLSFTFPIIKGEETEF